MRADRELMIRIDPDKRSIKVENRDGEKISVKEITEDAFYDCVKKSIKRQNVTSGFLPPNCFHVSIASDGSKHYCIWHPELYADISYFGTEYPHFPLPRLVFGFRVSSEGKVLDCRLGVTDNQPPTEKTIMYHYPFSNVGGFHLCTGNNPLPVYKRPVTLGTLPGYLLRLPNNNDSFNAQNNKLHMPYRELLNHLKDKEPDYYYSDILIPNGKTLNDFITGG